jgi:hypothetical protein
MHPVPQRHPSSCASPVKSAPDTAAQIATQRTVHATERQQHWRVSRRTARRSEPGARSWRDSLGRCTALGHRPGAVLPRVAGEAPRPYCTRLRPSGLYRAIIGTPPSAPSWSRDRDSVWQRYKRLVRAPRRTPLQRLPCCAKAAQWLSADPIGERDRDQPGWLSTLQLYTKRQPSTAPSHRPATHTRASLLYMLKHRARGATNHCLSAAVPSTVPRLKSTYFRKCAREWVTHR